MNPFPGASRLRGGSGGPVFPPFPPLEPRRAPQQRVPSQPPAPQGSLGLPSPFPSPSAPALAFSSFPVRRQLWRQRRREASEWRLARSLNTTRSQNAARSTTPFPFLVVNEVLPPLPPHPSGWETWALVR